MPFVKLTYRAHTDAHADVDVEISQLPVEDVGTTLAHLDEQVQPVDPFPQEPAGIEGLFAGDPDFGANIDVVPGEGSDPTD